MAAPGPIVARTRPIPSRKRLLYASHKALLDAPLAIFLRPTEISASEYHALRASLPPSAKLTVLRPGLLPALLRDTPTNATSKSEADLLRAHLKGPMAVLTAPDLHPPTLSKVLKIVSAFSATPSKNAPPPPLKPVPGASPPEKVQRLPVLSSILEERAFDPKGTQKVAALPELDVLRGQVVALIGGVGGRLVGLLGARGREVSWTIKGFQEGLKPKGEQSAPASPSS